jgi:hypothetical protein
MTAKQKRDCDNHGVACFASSLPCLRPISGGTRSFWLTGIAFNQEHRGLEDETGTDIFV